MADLTFGQQVAANGLAVLLGGALSILGGWGFLRRQERIKREEDLAAAIRKVQTDALVRVLAAFGQYHHLKARRLVWERDKSEEAREKAARFKSEEARAYWDAIGAITSVNFLLGGRIGQMMRGALMVLGEATSTDATEQVVTQLEQELAPWIPPLRPRS